jgi:hypothetical protein
MVILIMYDFVYSDDIPIVGGHHRSKHRRGYRLHSIHVAMSEQDIVIKWGFDKFDVDEDGFSPEFDGDILEDPFNG